MRNKILNDLSHILMRENINKNDVVCDATMGNGNDTLYLAGLAKYVYAFDIQQDALDTTALLLEKNQVDNTILILDSHENLYKYYDAYDYIVFNLGYLPKGDKNITTKAETTLKTLNTIFGNMKLDSFVQLMVYPGHPEGLVESKLILETLKDLNHLTYKIVRIDLPYQQNQPPYILLIQKIK